MSAVARPDVVEQIGQTPLIELRSFSTENVKLYAKLEWHNPFGSVKDRAAYWMIKHAEKKGILKKDKSIALAKAISKPRPDIYYRPNQYDNDPNFLSHYESTGPEIWKQTNRTVTHFLTGCGTGGTITGTATFLKEKNKNVHAVAIQAQKNHLLQGLRNFEESAIPELFKRRLDVVDEWMTATNKDSFEAVRQLVEKETMLVGPSSGSVMTSMLKVAHNLDHGNIVGIFADDGRKFRSLYIGENILTEQEYDRALKSAKYISKLAYSS